MKFHGLVFLGLLGLSESLSAQNGSTSSGQTFVPPPPGIPGTPNNEPLPLPVAPNPATVNSGSDSANDIEAELRQFRSELREFQAMREEVARNTKAAEADTDRSILQQRQEMLELLTKLAKNRVTRKTALPPAAPAEDEAEADLATEPELTTKPDDQTSAAVAPIGTENLDFSAEAADPFSLGKVLFRTGDFVGAEKAFRRATVAADNEMTLKYLLATCLRRQSKWKPSMDAYQIVAESNQDPVLRDLAKWQLENIRWHQQSESQLEQMRKQRMKKATPKTGAATKKNKSQP